MQKKSKKCCPTCNANLEARWEYITKGHLKLLTLLHEAIRENNRNSIHLQKDLDLTKNQYANFQKLRYNGLVAHAQETGHWLMTRRGAKFLRQEIDLPKGVLIFRNRIQKYHKTRATVQIILKGDEPYWLKKGDFDYETMDIVDYELDAFDNIGFNEKGQGYFDFGDEIEIND
jgi:hypothetical protein